MSSSVPLRSLSRRAEVVLGGLFVVVAAWVEIAEFFPGDERLLIELYDAFGTDLDDGLLLWSRLTDLVPLVILALGVTVLLDRADRRSDAIVFGIAVAVVFVGNPLMKRIFTRPRPSIRVIPEDLSTFSFPSGHASSTAAVVGALYLVARTHRARRAVVILGGAVLVLTAFSRLAMGAHYPSDILAGWLWVAAWMIYLASRRGPLLERSGWRRAPPR